MTIVLLSLGLGIAIGFARPLSPGGAKIAHIFTMAGLFILLASMGSQLGSNDKVLGELGLMGVQALVLAGCSVLGSVLLVYFARNYIYRDLEGKLARWRGGDEQ